MVWTRATAASLFILTIAPAHFAAASASTAPSARSSTVSGIVRDDAGHVIEGVEVLVLALDGQRNDALLRAVSDAGGHFLVGAIAPGVYRIAAIKSGYIAALGRVNTLLRSSVELVLRPIPKGDQPGAETVLPDQSWTLRLPPRSILRELEAGAMIASRDTGGARAFVSRVQDTVRGEVDHVFAIGSWRSGPSGPASSLAGNETRMRFAGSLGERGAIQVHGRRGTLDSSSSSPSAAALSRGASNINLDVSYDTAVDERLAMRAFYSTEALDVDGLNGAAGGGGRQSQRSFGYDAMWRKQFDASSRLALQVGFQDANLAAGQPAVAGWDPAPVDAWNRAIGAEGSYENLVGDGHLVRFGLRAQRLSLEAPSVRVARDNGGIVLDGGTGWSVLIDTEDRWSVAGPVSVTYGLAVRQGSGGAESSAATPRIGASWSAGRAEAALAVSYLAEASANGPPGSSWPGGRSPYGYEFDWKVRLDPTVTLSGTASYVPSQADRWDEHGGAAEYEGVYVSDGSASDRFVALELERAAASASVGVRVARGRVEGALASVLVDAPVVLLSDRALLYDAARIRVQAPRAGSAIALGYRSTREGSVGPGAETERRLRTWDMEFAQDLVRFAGGRASCRLLVTARASLRPRSDGSDADALDGRGSGSEDKRIGAGVSLAF